MRILIIYFETFLWFVIETQNIRIKFLPAWKNEQGWHMRLQHRDYNRCDSIIRDISGALSTLSSPHQEGGRDVNISRITVVT